MKEFPQSSADTVNAEFKYAGVPFSQDGWPYPNYLLHLMLQSGAIKKKAWLLSFLQLFRGTYFLLPL